MVPMLFIAWVSMLPLSAQTTAPGQRAELLYRQGQAAEKAGDPETARRAYTEALQVDPKHAHARYSLGQLKITAPKIAAKGREAKFGTVVIPEINLEKAPLNEALEALQVIVEKESADKAAPNIVVHDPQGVLAQAKITLMLKKTPAKAVLQYILDQASAKARYDEHAIVILPN